MARHGCDDGGDFDIVDADGWNEDDSYAMKRAPQKPSIQMTQQMTTKVAPAYDGRTSFFAIEDAIDDRCDITELESEKRGPASRNRLEGEKYSGIPTTEPTTSKDFYDLISSRVPKTCSYTVSWSS